ncbi:Rpn family recombination-promoting nuclease/putative transposase [Butyrivibrio sp. JL13D10]|uniref:Rpn family recombination-promoting nuclease/putative transposase n=1 Tax=Butyrivibrio sp. JL13D10 TaxID=3236815 RepID=UPI0038B5A030
MNESSNKKQIGNSKLADSGAKLIFENPTLCSQLLRDYSGIELLKDIKPEDIEDITERFIPMFTEERDADVVKKVHVPNGNDIFITLIEHKSSVDYNVIMQILRYMVYIWEDYEKQQENINKNISRTKGFKYPPIIPVVYYEGKAKWDAAEKLIERIALSDVFQQFIPDFKYHLINLGSYGRQDLLSKNNELSLVMLINSMKSAEDFKSLDFPEGYLDNIQKNSPKDVLETIARVIAVVLRKQNVPENEIWDMVDQIKERRHMGLFEDWEGFDVQEERRIGREEGREEGRKEGREEGRVEGKEEGRERHLIAQVCKKIRKGQNIETIADALEEDEEHIRKIVNAAEKYAPDYDVEKILTELSSASVQ